MFRKAVIIIERGIVNVGLYLLALLIAVALLGGLQ